MTSLASVRRAVTQKGSSTSAGSILAVNSAGIDLPRCPTAHYPADDWDKVIGVNLTRVFNAVRCQIPAMLARRRPIVNVSSVMGVRAIAGQPAYTAAKHGVIELTKAAALDHAAQGVRVNAVAPGFVETPLLSHLSEKKQDASLHRWPDWGRRTRLPT